MNKPSDIILKLQRNAKFRLEYSEIYAGTYQEKPFFYHFQNMAHIDSIMLIYGIGCSRTSSPVPLTIHLSEMFELCGGRHVVKAA